NFSRYSLSMLRQHQFSEEVQAVGSIPQLDYVVGFYYFHENVTEQAATPSSNRWNANGTGYTINSELVFPPITSANQGWDPTSWFLQRASRADANSYAGFGQATWTPASFDKVHLTGGLRWTKDERQGLLFTVVGRSTNFLFNFDNSRVDPMATLAFDATPEANLYFTYSTSFRAGRAHDRPQALQPFRAPDV